MIDVVPVDPDLPRQRRTITGGLVFSAFAILAVMFSLGKIPQIDALFDATNSLLRSHNDLIVGLILNLLPLALVGGGIFGLTYIILGHFNRTRRSA